MPPRFVFNTDYNTKCEHTLRQLVLSYCIHVSLQIHYEISQNALEGWHSFWFKITKWLATYPPYSPKSVYTCNIVFVCIDLAHAFKATSWSIHPPWRLLLLSIPLEKPPLVGILTQEERGTYDFLTPARYMVPGKIRELNQWVLVVLGEQTWNKDPANTHWHQDNMYMYIQPCFPELLGKFQWGATTRSICLLLEAFGFLKPIM
jgi:hypothetical protein